MTVIVSVQRPHLFWRMARVLVLDIHEQLGGDKEAAMRDGEFRTAKPNPAHTALADLEAMGKLCGIVTQNIDGLHQVSGQCQILHTQR